MPSQKMMAIAAILLAAPQAYAVTSSVQTINGLAAVVWKWNDSTGHSRTVAIKREGNGNTGHGGYAIQFTYVANARTVTINADPGGDGGFGYFVSHERYRTFAGGAVDTIASHIFHKDDSPLGLNLTANHLPAHAPAHSGAQRFLIDYGHYGTVTPDPVNPNTGADSIPLPAGTANYAFYTLPVTITWVFQDGTDYPRIDISMDISQVVPPGGTTPTADLVSFDLRGPYGVMLFDNNANGTVNNVLWADQEYLFKLATTPVTRDTAWT